MKFFVDLGNKRAEMELLRKLPGIEIPHGRRLDIGRIDLRLGDGFPACFDDDVTQRLAFFFEVSLRMSSCKVAESMTHGRPSPQNAFVGWGFERKIANRSTDINFFALETEQ